MGQRGQRLPRLKELRLKAGLTQAELAAATAHMPNKVGMTTINRIERLNAFAETRTARALADALGVTVADLMAEA